MRETRDFGAMGRAGSAAIVNRSTPARLPWRCCRRASYFRHACASEQRAARQVLSVHLQVAAVAVNLQLVYQRTP